VISLNHCTFSATAESSGNTAIIDESQGSAAWTLNARNNLFYLPGSAFGAVRANVVPAAVVNAGVNLRYVGSGSAAADQLTGTIVTDDPLLSSDLVHLTPSSPAIDGDGDVGLAVDIDGDARPLFAGFDLGADEATVVLRVNRQLAADCNQDGERDISDVLCGVEFLFGGFLLLDRIPPVPPCATPVGNLVVLDVNGDVSLNVSDIVYLANYLFLAGPPPVQGTACFDVDQALGCPDDHGCQ
jgi:hypothetical protein